MFTKIISLLLVVLLVGCGINQNNQSRGEKNLVMSENHNDILTNEQETNEIQPKTVKYVFQNSLISGASMNLSFQTTRNMKYFKIWVKATSSSGKISVSVSKNKPDGKEIGFMTVQPGKENILYSSESGVSAGTYYINFSGSTQLMNGYVTCKLTSTYKELMQ